jgi:hypothetical protein
MIILIPTIIGTAIIKYINTKPAIVKKVPFFSCNSDTIGREDVAEEILRVATLPEIEPKKYHGHGIYIVDMK